MPIILKLLSIQFFQNQENQDFQMIESLMKHLEDMNYIMLNRHLENMFLKD